MASSKSKHKRMQHRFRLKAKRRLERRKTQGTPAPANPPEAAKT